MTQEVDRADLQRLHMRIIGLRLLYTVTLFAVVHRCKPHQVHSGCSVEYLATIVGRLLDNIQSNLDKRVF